MDSIPARLRRNGTQEAYNLVQDMHTKKVSNGGYAALKSITKRHQAAKSLHAMGVHTGKSVAILSFNRPEWVIADVACMMTGGVPAGIYQTCSPVEVQYIIHHSESLVVFVENQEQWEKVHTQLEHLPLLKHIITFKGCSIDHPMTMTWEDFLRYGEGIQDETIHEHIDAITPDQPATFIYTSGTTGPPKAVMLSHNNLIFTADRAISITELQEEDCTLSYLPLSHIAEQVFSIHGPISAAAAVFLHNPLTHY